ncbi:3'-5' exonuclease domain-containing protein [Artemisia annua]|uniref:3'-5' exonuclease domain-containing protein n=1 Tax=Artemisia annua TaxID=35608 RepID=A0A2U1N7A4_ARTAN|nr:3'-5' exonuclease domain-containing protein [Artemisia annua]
MDIFHLTREIEASDMSSLEAVMNCDEERLKLEEKAECLIGQDDGGEEFLEKVYERLVAMDASTAQKRAAEILKWSWFNKKCKKRKPETFLGMENADCFSTCCLHNHLIERIHSRRLQNLVVGLDIEWRPNQNADMENQVAVLQLCVGRRCLIFQIMHAPFTPKSLIKFLSNPNYIFVGVGVNNDASKLWRDYRIGVGRTADLRALAVQAFNANELKTVGLKGLTRWVLGKDFVKPKYVTMSRWDNEWLTLAQVWARSGDVAVNLVKHIDDLKILKTGEFDNYLGCGNIFNCNHPDVRCSSFNNRFLEIMGDFYNDFMFCAYQFIVYDTPYAFDPDGKITIKWVIISWTLDVYVEIVTMYNFQQYRRLADSRMDLQIAYMG